jgi:fructoselysine-6-P-deglycase FrlB-like protein
MVLGLLGHVQLMTVKIKRMCSTSIRSLDHAEKEKERLVDEVEEKEIRNTELLIGACCTSLHC